MCEGLFLETQLFFSGNTADSDKITLADISFKFGIVMTLSGLLGVPLGSYVSQMIRHQIPNADPIVCATTLLASVPLLFFGFVSANYSLPLCYGLTFFAGNLYNCCIANIIPLIFATQVSS